MNPSVTQPEAEDRSVIPTRCESRMAVKRPPLRRTQKSYRLPSLCDDSSSDDSDDDNDKTFCSSILLAARGRVSFDSDRSEDSDSDEDDELGQIIRFTPVHVESLRRHKTPEIPPPSPLPPNPVISIESEEFDFSAPPVYHGYSYNALAMVKKVWNSRRYEWTSGALQFDQAAYDGIDASETKPSVYGLFPPPPPPPNANRHFSSAQVGFNTRVASSDPNAPIYPRIGDLSSLRDCQSAIVDRAFCKFPMYTIHKILYLHDMLNIVRSNAMADRTRSSSPDDCDEKTLVGDDTAYASEDGKTMPNLGLSETVPFTLTATEWERGWLMRWQVLLDTSRHEMAAGSPAYSSCKDSEVQVRVLEVAAHEHEHEERLRMSQNSARPQSPKFFFAEGEDDDGDDYDLGRFSCSLPGQLIPNCHTNTRSIVV